jgi:hypothetical protein
MRDIYAISPPMTLTQMSLRPEGQRLQVLPLIIIKRDTFAAKPKANDEVLMRTSLESRVREQVDVSKITGYTNLDQL